MNKPCPYCGQEPLMYKGKKSGDNWVHCHNGSYKGVQGVECPIADHSFTVEEWNYRPHEVKLVEEYGKLSEMWQIEHAEKLTLIEKLKFAEERIKYLRATIMNEIEDEPKVNTEAMMFYDQNGGGV